MTSVIKAADANISSAEIKTNADNRAVCTFEIEVRDLGHLNSMINALLKIKKVIKVQRLKTSQKSNEPELA